MQSSEQLKIQNSKFQIASNANHMRLWRPRHSLSKQKYRLPYCWFPFSHSMHLRLSSVLPPIYLRYIFDCSSIVLRFPNDSRTIPERSPNGGWTKDERRMNEGWTRIDRRTNENRTKSYREAIENRSKNQALHNASLQTCLLDYDFFSLSWFFRSNRLFLHIVH